MLDAYEQRLVAFYLANAAAALHQRDREAPDLAEWIADRETGARAHWIHGQQANVAAHPAMEVAADEDTARTQWTFQSAGAARQRGAGAG